MVWTEKPNEQTNECLILIKKDIKWTCEICCWHYCRIAAASATATSDAANDSRLLSMKQHSNIFFNLFFSFFETRQMKSVVVSSMFEFEFERKQNWKLNNVWIVIFIFNYFLRTQKLYISIPHQLCHSGVESRMKQYVPFSRGLYRNRYSCINSLDTWFGFQFVKKTTVEIKYISLKHFFRYNG